MIRQAQERITAETENRCAYSSIWDIKIAAEEGLIYNEDAPVESLSNDEIYHQLGSLDMEIASLRKRHNAVEQEERARRYGVRVGQWISIGGKDYQVCALDDFWISVRAQTKAGNVSNNVKHCYNWKEYRAGKAKLPW